MTDETHASGETIYPAALRERDWWVNWVRAYRHDEIDGNGDPVGDPTPTKQPVDPEQTGTADPCRWNSGLDDDEHPSTDFETVENWEGWSVGSDVPASERVISDELGLGIIIPVGGGDGRQVTLIDWDDVRDPETGETHPLCAYALGEADGWAEISQSGEGIHQFVFGTIPGGLKKYIRHIDDEPFVGDDLPAVEMYQSGRLTAMTGRHVAGAGRDVVEGDELLTDLVARTQDRGNASTDNPTRPLGDDDYETPSREEVEDAVRSQVEYAGADPEQWEIGPDSSVKYAAVLRGRERSDKLPNTANWKLMGYAATLGKALGKSEADVRADLKAHPTPQYGHDPQRAKKEVRSMFRKMEQGSTSPPSAETLKQRGLLPNDYVELDELHTDDTLSCEEKWNAWAEARRSGELTAESEVPVDALEHIAREHNFYDFDALDVVDELPPKAHNRALWWVNNVWPEGDDVQVTLSDDGDATARNGRKADTGPVRTWEDVRYIYEKSKEKGRAAARSLLADTRDFMTLSDMEQLMLYDPETGVYTDETGPINGEIYDGLGDHWSTHEKNEIVSGLLQQNVVHQSELNGEVLDGPHICVENGVLNLFTRELKEHSPDYYFTERVPVTYDPDADTAPYREFVDEVVERDADRKVLFEMVGHALMPDANERYKKFLILTGDADNGKSVFFRRVKALLDGPKGEEKNTASVKLSKIAQNQFSMHSLYGAKANIAGEIDGKRIQNTAAIKDITGGDTIEIEPKGLPSFFTPINSTLMFAANDPPIIGKRDKEAIRTRIVPVELPYTFTDEPEGDLEKEAKPERELKDELETDKALSGFLNLALDGLERLEDNAGDVSLPETPKERLRKYERTADPMREFGERCLTNDPDAYLVKADVTTMYREFANAEGYETGENIHNVLHNVLRGVPGLNYTDSRPQSPDYSDVDLPLRGWDERKMVVDRVSLTDEGLEFAKSAGLVEETPADPETEDENPGLNGLEPGRHTVEATVAEQLEPKPWLQGEGTLVDGDTVEERELLDYVARGDTDPLAAADEGDRVRITNAKVTTDGDGLPVLEVSGVCDVEVLPSVDDEQSSVDDAAAADGGETATREAEPQYTQAVAETVHDASEPVGVAYIIQHTEGSPEPLREAIDAASEQGKIRKEGDDKYTA